MQYVRNNTSVVTGSDVSLVSQAVAQAQEEIKKALESARQAAASSPLFGNDILSRIQSEGILIAVTPFKNGASPDHLTIGGLVAF
jgi:hypothetical protein